MEVEKIETLAKPTLSERMAYILKNFLANYKRVSIIVIPFLLVILFSVFKLTLSKSHAERDYLSAKAAYAKWDKVDSINSLHLQTLKGVLKKRPELMPSYEGVIVQKFLAHDHLEEAKKNAENLLKRVGKHSSHYTQFSKATLSISEKKYEKALKKAYQLKESMVADKAFWSQPTNQYGSTLFAFNLVRIAMLNQKLGNIEDELLAWKELKNYARWDQGESGSLPLELNEKAINQTLEHFGASSLSLKDYIKHRERKLFLDQEK